MAGLLLIVLYSFYPMLFILYIVQDRMLENATNSFIWFLILFSLWFCVFIAVSIKNIIVAKRYVREKQKDKLRKLTEITKFGSIPFWIINFVILFFFTIAAIVGTRGIFIVFVPVPIFFSYLLLLGTSVFSISYVRLLYKEKDITLGMAIVHTILQLCFCWDIFDIIYLKYKFGSTIATNEQSSV